MPFTFLFLFFNSFNVDNEDKPQPQSVSTEADYVSEAFVTAETPQNNEPNNDTAVEVDYVLALYPYRANGTNELSFTQGDTLEVLNKE